MNGKKAKMKNGKKKNGKLNALNRNFVYFSFKFEFIPEFMRLFS
jgi:hypothetical protein